MSKEEKITGRKLALTIIVGVFIAIILVVLINLIVGYAYEEPRYDKICQTIGFNGEFPAKSYPGIGCSFNCTFNRPLNDIAQNCSVSGGQPIYEYDNDGCASSLKKCDFCNQEFDDVQRTYNSRVFFILALIGFLLIVFGLFNKRLLLQIVSLPAGAILVIESAVRNFNDKLAVIIVLALLVLAAVYLALKKLR